MKILRFILLPFSLLYGLIIELRNILFNCNIFNVKKVKARVISVGNIHLGGTGKTPTVIFLADLLKPYYSKIGILSRGYKRKSKGYVLVSDGYCTIKDVDKCGDEIFLTAQETGCAAAVCEKRVEGAEKLIHDADVDLIILDDGFQHRWIHRDINILLFDAETIQKKDFMFHKLLPSGYMREPLRNSKRADVIIINHKFSQAKINHKKFDKIFRDKPVFHAHYEISGLVDLKFNKIYSIEEFNGQKSLLVSGIANPSSFIKIINNSNIKVKDKILFGDHKKYSLENIQKIRKKFYSTNATSVLTTEKDAVKLAKYLNELDDIDIFYIKIKLNVENHSDLLKILQGQ